MNWAEFKAADPEMAYLGEERFRRNGLVLVGTLSRNGWPRISPVEPLVVEGALYLGMTWHSLKALDLLRDSRVTVNSAVSNRDGSDGEFKLYGRAEDVKDPQIRKVYVETLARELGYELGEDEKEKFHLFAVDIERAAFLLIEGGEQKVKVFPPSAGG